MKDATDATLIEKTLEGDERAFAELVRRYQAAVRATVHRLLGYSADDDDAVQETFLRAFTALRKFDRRYPFGPWIMRIATNYCIDQLRKRKGVRLRLWSELSEPEQQRLLWGLASDDGGAAAGVRDTRDYAALAQTLLNGLNPKYKAAFVLREVEEREYGEVAAILGTTEVTARVRVSRARAELQKKFNACLAGAGRGTGQ